MDNKRDLTFLNHHQGYQDLIETIINQLNDPSEINTPILYLSKHYSDLAEIITERLNRICSDELFETASKYDIPKSNKIKITYRQAKGFLTHARNRLFENKPKESLDNLYQAALVLGA